MSAFAFLWLAIAFVGCTLFPGVLIASRLRWRSVEGVCIAIAISHFVIYLIGTTVFLLQLPRFVLLWYSVFAVVTSVLFYQALLRIVSLKTALTVLLPQLCVLLWALLQAGIIRNYSGMFWYGDWFEHYERARYFLGASNPQHMFLDGRYTLTARPPFMNLLQSHFLAIVGTSFSVFQATTVALNALVFLPCVLLIKACAIRSAWANWTLAILLMANPMFSQNVVFTWTKLLTSFYVIFSIALYVRAWQYSSMARMVAAFAVLACGILVHYSAAPYAVFLAAHYLLVTFWKRPQRWRELSVITLTSGMTLATWFVWSIAFYGVKETVASNTTVQGFSELDPQGNGQKVISNVINTIVPYFVRGVPVPSDDQTFGIARFRDAMFGLYQVNLLFACGSIGWLLTLCGVVTAFKTLSRSLFAFWASLIVVCTVLGIAVHGEPDRFGLAHICLQPIVVIALVLQTGVLLRGPRLITAVSSLGISADLAAGIVLPVLLQSYDIPLQPGDGFYEVVGPLSLGGVAVANAISKHEQSLIFLGDVLAPAALALKGMFIVAALLMPLTLLAMRRPSVNMQDNHLE